MARQTKQKKHVILNVTLAVVFFIFLVTASTFASLAFTPLYRWVVNALGIPEQTGYSLETCVKNYKVLIDYNMFFGAKVLAFPDFPMSIEGATHFREVKQIFVIMQYAAMISGVLLIPGILIANNKKTYWWRKAAIILTLGVVVIVGTGMIFDWEGVFLIMHKILFRNDFWLFNPGTDPVINILPDTVFLAAGALILILMTVGLVVAGLVYRKKTKSARQQRKARQKREQKSGKNG